MSPGGLQRLQFGLLLSTMVVAQAALQATRPLISYRIIALGGGALEVGIAASAFAILSVLLAFPLGRHTDRGGSTLILILLGVLLGLVGAGSLIFAPNALAVIAASTVLGFAHMLMTVGSQGQVARSSADSDLDGRFGWLTAAVSAGQFLGPLATGLSLGSGDVTVTSSTQTAIVIAWMAVAALPIAVTLTLSGRQRAHPAPQAQTPDAAASELTAGALLRRPGLPSALLTSLALLAAVDIITFYLPLVAQERGIDAHAVGVLLAIRAGASLASRINLGRLSARWGRDLLITLSTLGSGVTLAAMALPVANLVALGAIMLVGGLLLGIGQPLTMTLVVRSVPASDRGAALALRLVANRLGQVVLPALAAVTTGSLGAGGALGFAALILAGSSAVNVATSRRHPPQ